MRFSIATLSLAALTVVSASYVTVVKVYPEVKNTNVISIPLNGNLV